MPTLSHIPLQTIPPPSAMQMAVSRQSAKVQFDGRQGILRYGPGFYKVQNNLPSSVVNISRCNTSCLMRVMKCLTLCVLQGGTKLCWY
jgi:hypothetical protein